MLYKKLLLFLLIILVFSCSKGDDKSNDYNSYDYKVLLSDDCYCDYNLNPEDFSICFSCIEIIEDEYLRLLEIQQNSTEPCIYVSIERDVSDPNNLFGPEGEGPFEGYLLVLSEGHCFSVGEIGHPI